LNTLLDEHTMNRHFTTLLLLALCAGSAHAEGTLTPQQFESLRQQIRPQAKESQWAAVPWLINLHAARERAAREDKPLFLWRSGGGDVLGRT
jgi:hypothetical protein